MRNINSPLNKLNEYKKNIFIIFSGSMLSQFILIGSTPWLSRLYLPESYGIYGLFIGVTSVLSAISTLRFTYAIQISDNQKEAQNILHFCQLFVVLFSVLTFFVILIINALKLNFFNLNILGNSIFLIPISILLAGFIEIYNVWLNRNKNFKRLSYNRIILSTFTIGISIAWAYLVDTSFFGLLIGMLIAQTICLILLHFDSRKYFENISYRRDVIYPILLKYKNFPKYSMPSDLINAFTNQLPVFMLNSFASLTEVGYYNMSNRILGLPSMFIGNAVGEVFRQKATENYNKKGTCRPLLINTSKFLAALAIFPFLIIAIFGPTLFSYVLGHQWESAGTFSQILSLLFFFRFFVSPVTYVFYIAQKQKVDMLGHFLMLAGTTIPFIIGLTVFENTLIAITFFSISYSFIYIIYYYLSYKFSLKEAIGKEND